MSGWPRRLPGWMQTIRFRLTVIYSAVLFGLVTLVLGGLYVGLSATVDARPLNEFKVTKVEYDHYGKLVPKEDAQPFHAADVASIESAVNYQTLEMLRTYSVLAIGILFVASLGTGWWLSGRVLRPVRRISETAQEISATDLSGRIGLTGPRDELRTLSETIDDMLARLDRAFAVQRQLVDDASHELRNPLAVIRANVDAVLATEDATPAARTRAATIVVRATDRMTYLVEDLLASARRTSPAFADVDVDLAELANEAADEYMALAAERDLRLARRLATGPVVAGDPQAVRRAVDNLMSNAVRLAPENSELVLAVGSHAGWAWIAVRDDGPGISPEERERIFDRFHRSPDGPNADPREHRPGLGLAIVRQIVESHGGSVAVHSELAVGSTFVLWLPDSALVDTDRRTSAPPSEDPLGSRLGRVGA